MVKLVVAKCPNCGADIEIKENTFKSICKYCGSTIIVDGNIKLINRRRYEKDEIDEKCIEISKKLNDILKYYAGDKNEMLIMLKEKIGLVTNNLTVTKYETMRNAPNFIELPLENAFKYKIGNSVISNFEYKKDSSVEVTYGAVKEGFFAIEYYGKILKYTNLNELSIILDEILQEIKRKFGKMK